MEQQLLSNFAHNPRKLIRLCWPKLRLYSKQIEMIESVRDNKKTFVHAANKVGKSYVLAIIALWWFLSRQPSRVITTSSSNTQLESILWGEINALISESRIPLPIHVNQTLLRKNATGDAEDGRLNLQPLSYVLGYVPRSVSSFEGHHLPNDKPRTLAIFDESQSIDDEYFDAADAWMHRGLFCGNPLTTSNFYYRFCKQGKTPDPTGECKLLSNVIHISGTDSPNVIAGFACAEEGKPPPLIVPGLLSYSDYISRETEWDDVKKKTRLYGEFWEGDQSLLFPMDLLDNSEELWRALEELELTRQAKAIGIDVAGGGRDNTVWTVIDQFGVLEQITMDTPDTMKIPGITIQLMKKWGVPSNKVGIDGGGGGKQIADRLAEQGKRIKIIYFGEKADDNKTHLNRRVEMYYRVRDVMDESSRRGGFGIDPKLHELRQELAILPRDQDSEGRWVLPPKDRSSTRGMSKPTLRSMLGRSPDHADSLVLAVWMLSREKKHVTTLNEKQLAEKVRSAEATFAEKVRQRMAGAMQQKTGALAASNR